MSTKSGRLDIAGIETEPIEVIAARASEVLSGLRREELIEFVLRWSDAPSGVGDDQLRIEGTALGRDNGWPLSARVEFDGDGRARALLLFGAFTEDPEIEITSRLVRTLPIHQMIEAARLSVARAHDMERAHGAADDPSWPFVVLDLDERLAASLSRHPGRGGRDDEEYARIAKAYAELVDEGAHNPVSQLADRFGVSRSTARNWMHEARSRGLSERPGSGRRGGGLTAKATALLGQDGAR